MTRETISIDIGSTSTDRIYCLKKRKEDKVERKKVFLLAIESRWWSIISYYRQCKRYNRIYSKDKVLGRKIFHFKKHILLEEENECENLFQACEKKQYHTIKIQEIGCGRIGECLGRLTIKLEEAKISKNKGIWDVVIWNNEYPCNKYLLKMVERYITVIVPQNLNGWMMFLAKTKTNFTFQKKQFRSSSKNYIRDNTIPFFEFTEEEKYIGEEKLKRLGIYGEYICIFTRDSSYLKINYTKKDYSYHNYRDSGIEKFSSTIVYFKEMNLLTVRMGQIVERKINIDNCVDFSSNYYDEFMDLFIHSRCKFFLGDFSGINFVPIIFSRPVALTNGIWVFSPSFGGWLNSEEDIFIVKKYFSISQNRFLTFSEMFSVDNELIIGTGNYEEYGIKIIDNTEEDIKDLAEEMLLKLNCKWIAEIGDEERQQSWKNQLKQYYIEHNLNLFDSVQIKMGDRFLRKNQELLAKN